MKFSIIIPTMQKNVEILTNLLDSLNADNSVSEIILIDNSLTGFKKKFEKLRVIVPNENLFVNKSWNLGVDEAKCDYIGLLNDDIEIVPDFCSMVLGKMNENIGIVGLNSEFVLTKPVQDFGKLPQCKDIELKKTNFRTVNFGSAMFFHKNAYFKIPETMKIYYGDDFLLYKNKGKSYTINGVFINHVQSMTVKDKAFEDFMLKDKWAYKKLLPFYKQIFEVEELETTWKLRILGLAFTKRKRIATKKILVHFHLFYPEQVNFFVDKLANISDCSWDLFVTYIDDLPESFCKIKKLKPDTKFIKVNNIGYDILPFIQVLKSISLDNYDYVLKLHTKSKTPKTFSLKTKSGFSSFSNYDWRNKLVNALIGSEKQFKKNLNDFEGFGFICADDCLAEMSESINDIKTLFNLSTNYNYFCAGTMFFIKSCLLKKIIDYNFSERDFDCKTKSGVHGTLAHKLERIFILFAIESKEKIKTVKRFYFKNILSKLFSIQNVYSDNIKYKYLTIFNFSYRIK